MTTLRERDATRAMVASVSSLSVSYRSDGRDVPVLQDVSLTLDEGEAVAIVGESGCGKSTLASAFVGHLRAGSRVTSGALHIDGQDILRASPQAVQALRRGVVGLVPQNAGHCLTPSMRVGRQVIEVLLLTRTMNKAAARAEAIRLFKQVRLPEPEALVDRYPHQLSGGQQQRVAVAIAIAGQPRLLVLDEPTTGLDVVTQAGVLALFDDLRRELGITLIFVSHDLGAVAAVCDRVAVMYAGRIVEAGLLAPTFERPAHPYTRGLLASVARLSTPGLPTGMPGTVGDAADLDGCAFAPRCSFVQPRCSQIRPDLLPLTAAETGGDADPVVAGCPEDDQRAAACLRHDEVLAAPAWESQVRVRENRTPGEEVLAITNLCVDYRRRPDPASGPTVDGVDLTLHRGEVVALVGESGSGKSTIAWTVAGLRNPSGGSVELRGDAAADLTAAAKRRDPAVRRRIQLVFQNAATALNPRRTVGDSVSRVLRLRGLRGTASTQARDAVLTDVGLGAELASRLPGQLSGGQQQRIGIARALAADPSVVLADEVVSALDVSVQASVLRLLDDLREEHDLAYLFISHDLAVVRGLADRVVVLYLGRVCEEGPVEQVFGGVNHPYTQLLVSSVLAAQPGAGRTLSAADGEPESAPPPRGCPFQRRCPHHRAVCDADTPPWQELNDGHRVRCHVPVAELAVSR